MRGDKWFEKQITKVWEHNDNFLPGLGLPSLLASLAVTAYRVFLDFILRSH